MAVIDSLVAYYSLDEASGDAIDAHGANDLTDNNTVGSATGKVSGGRDFEISNGEFFSLPDNTDLSLDADTAFTLVAWLNTEDVTFLAPIVHKGGGGNSDDEYKLLINNGSLRVNFVVGNGSSSASADATSFGALSNGTWYFVAARHDPVADKLLVSVNGGAVDEAAWSGGTQNTSSAFNIGGLVGSGVKFDGILDEIGFWKRCLSDADITWLYNSGNGRSYADIVAEAGGAGKAFPPFRHAHQPRFLSRRKVV